MRVEAYRTNKLIAVEIGNGLVEDLLCRASNEAGYVLHQEEFWTYFSHYPKKVAQKVVSWIGRAAFSDGTEPLARRPADDSIDIPGGSIGGFKQRIDPQR